jgi:hypothetical protein
VDQLLLLLLLLQPYVVRSCVACWVVGWQALQQLGACGLLLLLAVLLHWLRRAWVPTSVLQAAAAAAGTAEAMCHTAGSAVAGVAAAAAAVVSLPGCRVGTAVLCQ